MKGVSLFPLCTWGKLRPGAVEWLTKEQKGNLMIREGWTEVTRPSSQSTFPELDFRITPGALVHPSLVWTVTKLRVGLCPPSPAHLAQDSPSAFGTQHGGDTTPTLQKRKLRPGEVAWLAEVLDALSGAHTFNVSTQEKTATPKALWLKPAQWTGPRRLKDVRWRF